MQWQPFIIAFATFIAFAITATTIWYRRSQMSRNAALAYARSLGTELARLPGRLRRVAADPRTPRLRT